MLLFISYNLLPLLLISELKRLLFLRRVYLKHVLQTRMGFDSPSTKSLAICFEWPFFCTYCKLNALFNVFSAERTHHWKRAQRNWPSLRFGWGPWIFSRKNGFGAVEFQEVGLCSIVKIKMVIVTSLLLDKKVIFLF